MGPDMGKCLFCYGLLVVGHWLVSWLILADNIHRVFLPDWVSFTNSIFGSLSVNVLGGELCGRTPQRRAQNCVTLSRSHSFLTPIDLMTGYYCNCTKASKWEPLWEDQTTEPHEIIRSKLGWLLAKVHWDWAHRSKCKRHASQPCGPSSFPWGHSIQFWAANCANICKDKLIQLNVIVVSINCGL